MVVAAGGPKAAHLAGRKGDGLIATEPRVVEAYRSAGGSGPRYTEVALCYAGTEEEARKTAHHYFRWSITGWPVMMELPTTESFAAATRHVSPEAVAQLVSCGPSPEPHLAAIDRSIQAGFDHLLLIQVGPDQHEFIDFFERELAPVLHTRRTAAGYIEQDLSERSDDKGQELARMRKFFEDTREILDNRRPNFISTYAFAVAEMANKAWTGADDENRVKQDLANLLKRGFKGLYVSLAMRMDIVKALPVPG